MKPKSQISSDDARLLPRHRADAPQVGSNYQMIREQARIFLENVDLDDPTPLKQAMTKPGDEMALRGIPAIGRSVAGEMARTHPEKETIRRGMQSFRMRERLGEAA